MNTTCGKKTLFTWGVFALLLGLACARPAAAQTWTQLSPIGGPPGVRTVHSAVFNPINNRMIVFGGFQGGSCCTESNEVWVLSNADGSSGPSIWTKISPTGGPPSARGYHSAVYDAANNRMMVFAGDPDIGFCFGAVNDVWVLANADGTGGTPNWTQLNPIGGPPELRQGTTAVYDSATNRMIAFGGRTNACQALSNETWVLNNANGLGGAPVWTKLAPVGGPPSPRQTHSAVYDSANNRMVVFGGSTSTEYVNDAWVLEKANGLAGTPVWTRLNPIGDAPTARTFPPAVYDPATNRMVVFGGFRSQGGYANDLWALDNANGIGGTPHWTQLSPAGTPPNPRGGHSAVFNATTNHIIVFGGDSPSGLVNDVWVLGDASGFVTPSLTSISVTPSNPTINVGQNQQFAATGTFSDGSSRALTSGNGTWATKAPMPTSRWASTVGAFNGKIVVAGGYNGSHITTVETFDTLTNTWATKNPKPSTQTNAANGVINGVLYAAGGTDCCVEINDLWAYDPTVDTWTPKAPLPSVRQAAGGGVINGQLHVVGGTKFSQILTSHHVYNPVANTWTPKAPMPTARTLLGVGVVNGVLYAVGGLGSDFTSALDTVEAYDPLTNTWTDKAPMPTARFAVRVGVVKGILYAVGGSNSSGVLSTVEAYDPLTNTWTTATPMPTARDYMGVSVVNQIIYSIGGVSGVPPGLVANEAFTPAEATWSSSNTSVAPINASGLSTGTSPGATTITASSGSVNGNTSLTVANPNRRPVANAGSDQTVEATSPSGASVTLDGSGSSDPDGDALSYNWTGSFGSVSGVSPTLTFALGTHAASLAVNDGQATATDSVQITVRDTTAPVLSLPASFTAEATSATGATIHYSATAADTVNPSPSLNCAPATGTTFALGTTTVNCSAADASGNSASGSFTVSVVDTTRPVLSVPSPITVFAIVPADGTVFYSATATDAVDPHPSLFCSPASGTTFPLGTTTVLCFANDASNNGASASFTITIIDSAAPALTVPGTITAEATGPGGATVSYSVSATDGFDPDPVVSCSPASGSLFALGTTVVNCSATDDSDNSVSASFSVNVVDTTPPVLTVPAPITVNATSPAGAVVNFSATAADNVDANPSVSCSPASGSTYALGTTTVTCTATDFAGNAASASFTVRVVYSFNGFFQPVDNPPTLNMVKAGSAIPVKFSLNGNFGLSIFAAGYPRSQTISCELTTSVNGIEETVTAGGSSLTYDASADRYKYVWKTDKTWAGTCRQLVVQLNDGTFHWANFMLK